MREDTAGLFWDDTPPPRITKPPPPKREPPPRTWEDSSYLPGLAEAKAFNVNLFSADDLVTAANSNEPLIFDTECFFNYWLIAFTSLVTGKVMYFELTEEWRNSFNDDHSIHRLQWITQNFTLIGFNSFKYDLPMLAVALAGATTRQLKQCSDKLIIEQIKPWLILRSFKTQKIECDHIDLIEVCPLMGSLKIYAGRCHVPKMQELPFNPHIELSENQVAIVRWYCVNDLTSTAFLAMELKPNIELRSSMSIKYGVDLRSKSDAQIAEAVLTHELTRINFSRPTRPEIESGTMFNYQVPDYIRYENQSLLDMLELVRCAKFVVEETGYVEMPKDLANLKIELGNAVYRMGIGGLHSSETSQSIFADSETFIVDRDVASYYPSIILNQRLFPKHLGPSFLTVYQELVERRLKAKKEKNKTEADTLKIVINGSFGKLGNRWSALYAPDLLIQVTLTGQLSLLMLIEMFELFGIPVISGNTDGVILKIPVSMKATAQDVVRQWERATGFATEETEYRGIFSRDVNNYIAVKKNGGVKVKGEYAERGSAGNSILSKNPVNLICNDAVCAFLESGTPIIKTIRECKDIRRFVTIRTVKGGAVKDGEYLGKAIRWYYANEIQGEIIYAISGNKVPRSDGAKPLMELPSQFPQDVNYEWYEAEALSILTDIGYSL